MSMLKIKPSGLVRKFLVTEVKDISSVILMGPEDTLVFTMVEMDGINLTSNVTDPRNIKQMEI